jgi:hypothetical protein
MQLAGLGRRDQSDWGKYPHHTSRRCMATFHRWWQRIQDGLGFPSSMHLATGIDKEAQRRERFSGDHYSRSLVYSGQALGIQQQLRCTPS